MLRREGERATGIDNPGFEVSEDDMQTVKSILSSVKDVYANHAFNQLAEIFSIMESKESIAEVAVSDSVSTISSGSKNTATMEEQVVKKRKKQKKNAKNPTTKKPPVPAPTRRNNPVQRKGISEPKNRITKSPASNDNRWKVRALDNKEEVATLGPMIEDSQIQQRDTSQKTRGNGMPVNNETRNLRPVELLQLQMNQVDSWNEATLVG